MMGDECPECTGHLVRGKCRACGWKPPADAAAEPKAHDPNAGRCAWQAAHDRCGMRGEYSPSVTGGNRWLCLWHAACRNPKDADNADEFSTWLGRLGQGYCSVWHHYDPADLWRVVQGWTVDLSTQRFCELPSCTLRRDAEVSLGSAYRPIRRLEQAATHTAPVSQPSDLEARKVVELDRFRAYLQGDASA